MLIRNMKYMDLVINKYGTRIRSVGDRIKVVLPHEKKQKEYAARNLDRIEILTHSSISTSAIHIALKHGVDITYLGDFGKPVGRIISTRPEGQSALRRAQAVFVSQEDRCLEVAQNIVRAKTDMQIAYMESLSIKYKKDFSREITLARRTQKKIEVSSSKTILFGIEGYIAEKYFAALKMLFLHNGRNPKGGDLFNSALNYGYGMLYNEIESACLHTGLDPYLGLYHDDRSNKPSLVCDLIEEFRVPIVDAGVMPLIITEKLTQEKHIKNGKLSKSARRRIVVAIKKQMQKKVNIGREHITLEKLILHQARALSHVFLDRKMSYYPTHCSFNKTHE